MFSDAELSQLKWNLDNPAPNWVDKDNLRGLVARLEAAERYIKERPRLCFDCENEVETSVSKQAFQSWLRSCGR